MRSNDREYDVSYAQDTASFSQNMTSRQAFSSCFRQESARLRQIRMRSSSSSNTPSEGSVCSDSKIRTVRMTAESFMIDHEKDKDRGETLKMSPFSKLLALPIKFYRRYISPNKGSPTCRFTPTCSQYALDALSEWGAIVGSALAVWRVLRCNPFGGCGYDPVPINRRRRAQIERREKERAKKKTERK